MRVYLPSCRWARLSNGSNIIALQSQPAYNAIHGKKRRNTPINSVEGALENRLQPGVALVDRVRSSGVWS